MFFIHKKLQHNMNITALPSTFAIGSPIPEALRRRPTVLAPGMMVAFVGTVQQAIVVQSRTTGTPSLRFLVATPEGKTIQVVQGETFDTVPATVRVETAPIATERGQIYVFTAFKA